MKCKRCLNEDPEWFYLGSKGWYCRKCISFGRILIEEDLEAQHVLEIQDNAEEYTLKYPLTKQQVKIAAEVIRNIETTDVLVKAVCGAGKTEIVVPVISEYLSKKKKCVLQFLEGKLYWKLLKDYSHISKMLKLLRFVVDIHKCWTEI